MRTYRTFDGDLEREIDGVYYDFNVSYEKSFLDIAATRTDDSYTIKEVVSFTINEAFYHDDENNKHDTPDEIVKQFEKGLLEESEERAI